jgi:hypothetical protein
MNKEAREKLFEIFHKPVTNHLEFNQAFEALAASLTEPILAKVDWYGLKVVNEDKAPAGQATKDIQTEHRIRLKDIEEGSMKEFIDTVAGYLSNWVRELSKEETEVTPSEIHIVTPFVAYPDHTVLRRQCFGIYGWMKVYFK